MFVDTHAHLTDVAFQGEVEDIVKRANDCMVKNIITSGYDLQSSFMSVQEAKRHNGVYASVGVYPENIAQLDEKCMEQLAKLGAEKEVVAIGEIGLQYTPNMPDRELQKEGFARQLTLAYSLKKPIVIHCRDAYGDMLELLQKNKNLLVYGGTMHCFGGSKEVARQLIKLGLHISVGGVSTFKNAEGLREVIKSVPLERILLETDCPYLTPSPYRGKRNSPEFIPIIAQNLGEMKGIDVEEVGNITTENARRLFKI